MADVKQATNALHEMYALINRRHFKNALPVCALTIQTKGKRNAYGWCTLSTIWDAGESAYHEINVSAEYLNRGALDVYATVLHEAVHLFNAINGVQDCSRNGKYHNTRFKNAAEQVGLVVTASQLHGWAHTELTESEREYITTKQEKKLTTWESALSLARLDTHATSKRKNRTIKHTCPSCGAIARTNVETLLICGECDEVMEQSM